MFNRCAIGGAVAMLMGMSITCTFAQDAKKFPSWEGMWNRGSPVGSWDPTKPPGLKQEAPLTPEYQAVYAANRAKSAAGADYDPKATCGPVGMPRVMAMYEPMEIIIKPQTTYMLFESMTPMRRIFTDGRDWPKDPEPSFGGYSIGKWSDTDNDGTYDTLEIESRFFAGPRLYEGTGIPLHADNQSIFLEKLHLDSSNPDIMHNEITTIDHALTRPWTVSRFYRREHGKQWEEYNCTQDNRWVILGGLIYMTDSDGYLMPIQKNQPAPDPKYFQKYFKPAKN